jgi:hypothetical protein
MRKAHKNVYTIKQSQKGPGTKMKGKFAYQDELGYSGATSLFSCRVAQLVRNSDEYQVKE